MRALATAPNSTSTAIAVAIMGILAPETTTTATTTRSLIFEKNARLSRVAGLWGKKIIYIYMHIGDRPSSLSLSLFPYASTLLTI